MSRCPVKQLITTNVCETLSSALQSQRTTATHFSTAAIPAPQAAYGGLQQMQRQPQHSAATSWRGAVQQQTAAPGVAWGSGDPLNGAMFGAAAAAALQRRLPQQPLVCHS